MSKEYDLSLTDDELYQVVAVCRKVDAAIDEEEDEDDETLSWKQTLLGGLKIGVALGIALVVSYAIVKAVILVESII